MDNGIVYLSGTGRGLRAYYNNKEITGELVSDNYFYRTDNTVTINQNYIIVPYPKQEKDVYIVYDIKTKKIRNVGELVGEKYVSLGYPSFSTIDNNIFTIRAIDEKGISHLLVVNIGDGSVKEILFTTEHLTRSLLTDNGLFVVINNTLYLIDKYGLMHVIQEKTDDIILDIGSYNNGIYLLLLERIGQSKIVKIELKEEEDTVIIQKFVSRKLSNLYNNIAQCKKDTIILSTVNGAIVKIPQHLLEYKNYEFQKYNGTNDNDQLIKVKETKYHYNPFNLFSKDVTGERKTEIRGFLYFAAAFNNFSFGSLMGNAYNQFIRLPSARLLSTPNNLLFYNLQLIHWDLSRKNPLIYTIQSYGFPYLNAFDESRQTLLMSEWNFIDMNVVRIAPFNYKMRVITMVGFNVVSTYIWDTDKEIQYIFPYGSIGFEYDNLFYDNNFQKFGNTLTAFLYTDYKSSNFTFTNIYHRPIYEGITFSNYTGLNFLIRGYYTYLLFDPNIWFTSNVIGLKNAWFDTRYFVNLSEIRVDLAYLGISSSRVDYLPFTLQPFVFNYYILGQILSDNFFGLGIRLSLFNTISLFKYVIYRSYKDATWSNDFGIEFYLW